MKHLKKPHRSKRKPLDMGFGNEFFEMTPEAQATK